MVQILRSEIPEDEVDLLDYISEDSDDGDEELLQKKFSDIEPLITLDESFPNVVVVVGVPKVGVEKYQKLLAVLQLKIPEELQKKGAEVTGDMFSIDMPMDDNSMTKGFCFLTFASAFEAQHAAKHLSGCALDSRHKFTVSLMDNFDEITSRDESYRPPIRLLGFTREDFRWWLYDERAREQFVTRYQDETEIYWHDPLEAEPLLVYDGERERAEGKRVWTDFRVQWSSHGSYLVTFHRPGIALWAGDIFEKKVRFEHKDVKHVDFSPKEEYMISWDGSPASVKNERAIRVWRVITGELLRTFATPATAPRGGEFPLLLWSHNDEYVVRCSDKELFVYELPAMMLIEDAAGKRSSLKYPVGKFDWSPGDNIVSVWIPEKGDAPGRLLLVEIPSRNELASKNVYSVKDASMHWQDHGDYLCLRAIVARKTGKKGRKEFTQLEIFRMREKNIPVDTVHIEDVSVKQLHWEEGSSKRFAVIVENELTRLQAIRFYRISEAGATRDTVMVTSFEITSAMNYMKWSPHGSNFILASLGSDGVLMFCNLNENDKVDVLHRDEHFMVNSLQWSHCGRYIATCVCIPMVASSSAAAWRYGNEAGYNIWTFQGRLQYKCKKEKFYQYFWRPHPPTLLEEKKIEEIKRNLKDHCKRYDLIDEKLKNRQRDAYLSQRKEVVDEFQKSLDELLEWKTNHELYYEWEEAWDQFDRQFSWEEIEEEIEEELEVREELIG